MGKLVGDKYGIHRVIEPQGAKGLLGIKLPKGVFRIKDLGDAARLLGIEVRPIGDLLHIGAQASRKDAIGDVPGGKGHEKRQQSIGAGARLQGIGESFHITSFFLRFEKSPAPKEAGRGRGG